MSQSRPFFRCYYLLIFLLLLSVSSNFWRRSTFPSTFAILSEVKNYSIDNQRDIYNTFGSQDQNKNGIPLDPFDLMNRLQQIDSMNDATSPSDAIDEALNAFIESGYENVPIK